MLKTAAELRKAILTGPVPGSLVRTKRLWIGGVHRANVTENRLEDGVMIARVAGHWYPADDLEVIRGPVHA